MKPVKTLLRFANKTSLMVCVILKEDQLTIKEISKRIALNFEIRAPNRETVYRSLQTLIRHDIVCKKKAKDRKDSDRYSLQITGMDIDFIKNTICFRTYKIN